MYTRQGRQKLSREQYKYVTLFGSVFPTIFPDYFLS